MLASHQGGMHGNEAGDPWQPSREAGKASLACPGTPPAAHLEEGAETPPGSPSVGCFMAFPSSGAGWSRSCRWCIHTVLHCFHTHHHKAFLFNDACSSVLSQRGYFFPCKAPEKPEMLKEIEKVPLFFCSSQTSSKASWHINVVKQYKKSFAELLPSLHLTDQCDDLHRHTKRGTARVPGSEKGRWSLVADRSCRVIWIIIQVTFRGSTL